MNVSVCARERMCAYAYVCRCVTVCAYVRACESSRVFVHGRVCAETNIRAMFCASVNSRGRGVCVCLRTCDIKAF